MGIFAHNEERRITHLLESLLGQSGSDGFALQEIFVVASGCNDRTEEIVRNWANLDARIQLISEPHRNGKASSINQVLRRYRGDVLVLVNADASLFPDALTHLLAAFTGNDPAQIACGRPVPEVRKDLAGLANGFLWSLHNRTLKTLSDLRLPNHCCDEFMAIRRGLVSSLPKNLINDGAYFAAVAALHGFSVRFSSNARVHVATPGSVSELLAQRYRIVRGHRQIRRLLGIRPKTLNGICRERPEVAARIVWSEFAHQRFEVLAFLVVAVPIEICANLLAYFDDFRRREYDPVWRRVGRAA